MPSLSELRSELKALRKEHCPPVSRAKKEHIVAEIARYRSPAAASMPPVEAPAPIKAPQAKMKGPPAVEVAIAKAVKKSAKAVAKEAPAKTEKKSEAVVKVPVVKKKKGE
jgi:hypothetical protein